MEQNNIDRIMSFLADIKGEMGEIKGEMKGINNHLGTLNGSVAEQGRRINKCEEKIDVQTGRSVGWSLAIATAVSIIGLIISARFF